MIRRDPIGVVASIATTAWNRGLYGAVRGGKGAAAANMAMLWILNLSDEPTHCST